jgi:hypothetical protein
MFRVGPIDRMRRLLALAGLAALVACGDKNPTAPVSPSATEASDLLFFSKPRLLECGAGEAMSQTAVIDAAGGTISLGGTSVVFPAGALLNPTNVTLNIPASPYVEIDIVTDGQNQFLEPFLRPIVTISYARCDRSDTLFRLLSAWYIDSETKELLDRMSSFDNKLTRSVTFRASHFSGYAIAF